MNYKELKQLAEIQDALLLTAVSAVEPEKTWSYVRGVSQINSVIEQKRIDTEYWFPLVRRLRDDQRIPTVDDIWKKAKSMIGLSDDEVTKVLSDFYREIQNL